MGRKRWRKRWRDRPRRRNFQNHQNPGAQEEPQSLEMEEEVPVEASPTCCICSIDNPPYKCPSCRIKYCSVKCCKAHKESGTCEKTMAPPATPKIAESSRQTSGVGRIYREHLHPTEDTVSRKCMIKLVRGDALKKMQTFLQSEKIRSYIKILDNSQDPEPEIEAMMKDIEFNEFSSFALDVISEPEDPTKSAYENYRIKVRKELYAYFAAKGSKRRKR